MKNKSYFIYIAAYLAILLPTPGRFVFGLVLMIELLFLSIVGTLINSLIKKLKLEAMETVISMLTIIISTIFFRQIIVITYPEVALTLGYIFYLPSISLFMIGLLFKNKDKPLSFRLEKNLTKVCSFCISGIIFFLIRDIFGYGTFTFFGPKHQILEKLILSKDGVGILSIFATIPGAFILSGIFLFLSTEISIKFHRIQKAEEANA